MLLGTCFPDDGVLEIDTGDYEAQLSMWNNQNMLDYQLLVKFSQAGAGLRREAVINVKNGIPESSDPPEWLTDRWWLLLSTIPEFYSYIKEKEEEKRKEPKKEYNSSSLKVSYDTEYHYPSYISDCASHGSGDGAWYHREYFITLTPLGERMK
jgi:hypothetical protein